MTLGAREKVLWRAVEVSYKEAAEFLQKFKGLKVSRSKIYRLALEEGERLKELEAEQAGKALRPE